MAKPNERRGGAVSRTWVVLLIAAAAALVALGGDKLGAPKLTGTLIAGVAVMLVGLAAVLFSQAIAHKVKFAGETAVRLAGLFICAAGALVVFMG